MKGFPVSRYKSTAFPHILYLFKIYNNLIDLLGIFSIYYKKIIYENMVEAKGLEGVSSKTPSFCFPCSNRHCSTRRWNVLTPLTPSP